MENPEQVVERELKRWQQDDESDLPEEDKVLRNGGILKFNLNGGIDWTVQADREPGETDEAFWQRLRQKAQEREKEFEDEAKALHRKMQDEAIERQRAFKDEIKTRAQLRDEWARGWYFKTTDYTAYRFPRITWRDIWLAIWNK